MRSMKGCIERRVCTLPSWTAQNFWGQYAQLQVALSRELLGTAISHS